MSARPNLLASPAGRRWLFALLYLSEGAPIGFVWWTMPALLRGLGLSLGEITTLTTLATLPWILKFLAAPLVDAALNRSIPVKRWILVCQLAMAAALLPLALLDWKAQFPALVAVVVLHAVFAAVQDVGIDALAIHTVPRAELGSVNGWMQAGMLGGRAGVAAGGALLAGYLGDARYAVPPLAILIALPALALAFATREPPLRAASVGARRIARAVATRSGLAGLAVALLAGAGFEFFGVSAGPRLVDLGHSEATLALFYAVLAPAGLAIGALAGGALADRIGALRGTSLSLALCTAVLCGIALGDLAPQLPRATLIAFAAAYLTIGALTASSYALFMTLARGELAATRFSLFMAMTNACEAWSGFAGGRLADRGYGLALGTLSLAACLAALPLYLLGRNLRGTSDGAGETDVEPPSPRP